MRAWSLGCHRNSVMLLFLRVKLSLCHTAACQGIWLQRFSIRFQMWNQVLSLLHRQKTAVDLDKNPFFHGCNKHIDVRYHFRECVEQSLIVIKHVSTNEQRADTLTKALSATKFERMRKLLGVKNLLCVILRGNMLGY